MLSERDYMRRDNDTKGRNRPPVAKAKLNKLLKPVKTQRLYGAPVVVIAFMFGVVIGMAGLLYFQSPM